MNPLDCRHIEWTQTGAYRESDWRCAGCGVKMTCGEMVLWERIMEIRAVVNKSASSAAADRDK
jgi:hypothetical protein